MQYDFKIGDWVRNIYTKDASQIIELDEDMEVAIFADDHDNYEDIEHWKPIEKEWCWVNKKLAYINSFSSVTFSDGFSLSTADIRQSCTMEPFIGTLPSFLKK